MEFGLLHGAGGVLIHRFAGTGAHALDFPASLVFTGRTLFVTNLSLFGGGINSKLSIVSCPTPAPAASMR